MKKIIQNLGYEPSAIMTNVPLAWFTDKNITPEAYLKWYLGMNTDEERIFYHFISACPTIEILDVFLCFDGKVQLKARVAEFKRKATISFPNEHGGFDIYGPRNWMITCGPVVKVPYEIPQKGFQGFRYCRELF